MTPAGILALTGKTGRAPPAAGRCLLLAGCMVRLPASGLSGIAGTGTQRSGQ